MIAIARHKAKPSNWRRRMCLYGTCRRAESTAGLCSQHGAEVTELHNEILVSVGAPTHAASASILEGYVRLRMASGNVLSGHKAVMEATLGRSLKRGENVHHINGNRADNRPQNLELWTSCQPSGQRPDDLAEYARELLGRYGTDAERAFYRERGGAHV